MSFHDQPEKNMKPEDCILFSGAASGAEAAFGEAAERHGIEEVNFTFEGHNDARRGASAS
jgi:hypothetical protein